MKLYTNGCSFTHGADYYSQDPLPQTYGDFTYTHFIDKTVWPWLLPSYSDKINFVFNHGAGGTGHTRLVRSTLDFLSHLDENDIKDWIFVLQFSQPERIDFVDSDIPDMAYQVLPYLQETRARNEITCAEGVEDWFYFCAPLHKNGRYFKGDYEDWYHDPNRRMKLKSYLDYYYLGLGNEQLLQSQLKECMLLCSILDKAKVKYIITDMGMTTYQRFDFFDESCPKTWNDRHNLVNWLDRDNMVKGIAEILPYVDSNDISNYSDSNHPTPNANHDIAKYLLHEMEKRNWLT